MRKAYKIVLTPTAEGYLVTIPDFDSNTQGDDIADAMYMARDAIGAMALAMEELGMVVPEPGTGKVVVGDTDIVTYVDIDIEEYRRNMVDEKKAKAPLYDE